MRRIIKRHLCLLPLLASATLFSCTKDEVEEPQEVISPEEAQLNEYFKFDASKVEEMVRQPKLNENGEPMKYKNNVVATYESGKPKRYDHDGSYVTKNGREITYKKGDFVYLHKAGSTIYETVPTGNKLEATKVNEPIKAEGLGKIPEARDNTPQEVLRNGLAKAFRGALTGDFEGWKPSKEQISSIKESNCPSSS